MSSSILNDTAAAFRTGHGAEGRQRLASFLEEYPGHPEALALGAYEMQVRASSSEEHAEGQQYLEHLRNVAPNSSALHCVTAFVDLLQEPVEAAGSYGLAKASPQQPETDIGIEMLILADVASSEAQFQILCNETGSMFQQVVTPRIRALIRLFQREHDLALAEFRAGAEQAHDLVGALVKYPLDPAGVARLSLNVWRDCLMGEAMTLADLGQRDEAMARITWVSQQYHETSEQIQD